MSNNPVQAAEQPVHVEYRDTVARLTLNRPEMRNALGPDMVAALHDAVRAATADPKVRVIVIQAAANPSAPVATSRPCTSGPSLSWTRRATTRSR